MIERVWLAQDLFYYKYPFYLPDFFQQKLTKDEFEVQVEVLKTFSSKNIEKIFLIREFFKNYKLQLFNQQKTMMKGHFIQSIKVFQQYDLVENNYTIFSDGKVYDAHELTPTNISEGFIVYEKLSI